MIMRKKRRSRELSLDAGDNDCESYDRWEPPDLGEDPERRYARHERAELLRGAIRRLPLALRTAVELQQAQEYSVQELADSRHFFGGRQIETIACEVVHAHAVTQQQPEVLSK